MAQSRGAAGWKSEGQTYHDFLGQRPFAGVSVGREQLQEKETTSFMSEYTIIFCRVVSDSMSDYVQNV